MRNPSGGCGEHRQRGRYGKVALQQAGDLMHDIDTRDTGSSKAGSGRMDLTGSDGTDIPAAVRGNEDGRRERRRGEDIHDKIAC